MSQHGQGSPRRGTPSGHRSPAPPFRGQFPGPPPGWGSPIPPRMTQSPPPFLIRPMVGVGRQSPMSPVPFGMRCWSPAPGGSPIPTSRMMVPRPHYSPMSTSSHVSQSMSISSDGDFQQQDGFSLQPSYDMEFVYPPGLDHDTLRRQMSIPSEHAEEGGLTTAQIIAIQSQDIDYIDERLAEYQAIIQHLQDEQERVQKKTFVNWINTYLSRHVPPFHTVDLIEDLKDGTRLLALLSVLSGEKLPMEKGRNLRRPHFLSNCNTALQFLQSKRIKLVNINSSDIVDGKPAVVLGLVWTIILYFQIEENTKVLASLSYRVGSTPTPSFETTERTERRLSTESPSPSTVTTKQGRVTPSERWKQGARRALLLWVQGLISKKFGLEVNDFGSSWRDGNAFLAIINCINPGMADMNSLKNASNRTRLETAFRLAEELGVPRLLDPEDVDVPRPDEKSIMTYVAQFLHKNVQSDSFNTVQSVYDELLTWLNKRTQYMEHMKQTNALSSLGYQEYTALRQEMDLKTEPYNKLKTLVESMSMVGITQEAWLQLKSLWDKLESQLKEWQWSLDASLPEPFGKIGRWLAQAEKLLSKNDVPTVMDDEAARTLNHAIEEHKAFFGDYPEILSEFRAALSLPFVNQSSSISNQIQSMAARLQAVEALATKRVIHLKYLEHKCCLVAFIVLVENRLKQWTVKYGRQDHVQGLIEQYNNFVNRNQIFLEFDRANSDIKIVIDEYKREGGIDAREGRAAEHFLWEIGERWKSISTELRCASAMMLEVVSHWARYDEICPELELWVDQSIPMVHLPEDQRMEYFQDVSIWLEKFNILDETVNFLAATCDERVVGPVKLHFDQLAAKFQSVFQCVKQYQYVNAKSRMEKDFLQSLSLLQTWLKNAEDLLAAPQPLNVESARAYNEKLQQIHQEIDLKDEDWRVINKQFQALLPHISGHELEHYLHTIKKEKESLVRVRAQLPQRQNSINQLLSQQEALISGQNEISEWLSKADAQMNSYSGVTGGFKVLQEVLDSHRNYFSKKLYYKTMLESKNKLMNNIVSTAGPDERSRVEGFCQQMRKLNEDFQRVEQTAHQWEQKLNESIRCWRNYEENRQTVIDWLGTAEKLLNEKNFDSKTTYENHKSYFEQINDKPLRDMLLATQALQNCVQPNEYDSIVKSAESLKAKWTKIMSKAPVHLTKLEFRLEATKLESLLKEMDREITNEHQQLNKQHSPGSILAKHTEFFEHGKVPVEAKKCLEILSVTESRFSVQHPEDQSLSEQLLQAKTAFNCVSARVQQMQTMLNEIPEQWNAYKNKFAEVESWMDTVDHSLQGIMTEVNSAEEFEREKTRFLEICRDVDCRRNDMKQLVQMLDLLVSRRADEESLEEQNLLEKLIKRYKRLVPAIEVSMIKTETHSRCYTYIEETKRVCQALERVEKLSIQDLYPDSLEEVERMIETQQSLLNQLENQRSLVTALQQKGNELTKDPNAPAFVQSHVQELDGAWTDVYNQSNQKLQQLKATHKIWTCYRSQREDIIHLLDETQLFFENLTPGKDSVDDLQAKQSALHIATEDTLQRLKDLCSSLTEVSKPEKKPVLEKEVQEIEKRLLELNDLLDQKIRQLLEQNEKMGGLAEQIAVLREWMIQAQRTLQDILNSEMAPGERVRQTRELQQQVLEKMAELERLEKALQGAEDVNLVEQVGSLRGEMQSLGATVEVQTAQTTQALEVFTHCQADLEKVNPWLEQAELKLAMGLKRPASLQESRLLSQQIREFALESKSNQALLDESGIRAEKIGKLTSAKDDIDAVKARCTRIGNTVAHWADTSGSVAQNWEQHENAIQKAQSKLDDVESKIGTGVNYGTASVPELEAELLKLKELSAEVAKEQTNLPSLTKQYDSLVQHVSPEAAVLLSSNLTSLKSKCTKLADSIRANMNAISDAKITRQSFEGKVKALNSKIEDLSKKLDFAHLDYDTLDSSFQHVQSLAQEHGELEGQFQGAYEDVKRLAAICPSKELPQLSKQYSAISEQYQSQANKLNDGKKALSEWVEFHNWHSEINDSITHIEKRLEVPGADEVILNELVGEVDLVANKLNEWEPKAKALDSLSSKASLTVHDSSNQPVTALSIQAQVKEKVNRLKMKLGEFKNKSDLKKSQWGKLQDCQDVLSNLLLQSQEAVLTLKPDKCDLPSLEKVCEKLRVLEKSPDAHQTLKAEIHSIGKTLMQEDQTNMATIQGIIQSSDANCDKMQALVKDKLQDYTTAVDLWKKYLENKAQVQASLVDADAMIKSASQTVPNDSVTAAATLGQLKRCVENLNKIKPSLIACTSLNANLCSALHSLPNLEGISVVSDELVPLKAQYENCAKGLATTLAHTETQLVLWNAVESTKDSLLKWLADTKQGLQNVQKDISRSEIVRQKLDLYKEELGEKYNSKMSLQAKISQLQKLNEQEIPALSSISSSIDESFNSLDQLAKDLEKSVSNFEDQHQTIKSSVKAVSDKVLRVKDKISKCEDRTGPMNILVERLKTLQEAKVERSNLEPQIKKIEDKILSLKPQHPMITESPINSELKSVSKTLEACSSQIESFSTGLKNQLEKNYGDKFNNARRSVANLVESLKWCEPKGITDGYTLETVRSTLKEIEQGVREVKDLLPSMQEDLNLYQDLEDFPRLNELYLEYSKLINDLDYVERNVNVIQPRVSEFSNLWNHYSTLSEDVINGLKDIEDKTKVATGPVELANVSQALTQVEMILHQISCLEPKMIKLNKISDGLLQLTPESRSAQMTPVLNARYQNTSKQVEAQVELLQDLEKSIRAYNDAMNDAKAWVVDEESNLASLENLLKSGAKPGPDNQDKLRRLKQVLDSKVGQGHLKKLAESGEEIIHGVPSESKEIIRNQVRELRDRINHYQEAGTALVKKIEAVQLNISSFEEPFQQVCHWLEDVKTRVPALQELQPNLLEKRAAHNACKALELDFSSHSDIVSVLGDKVRDLRDQDATRKFQEFSNDYNKMQNLVKSSAESSKKNTLDHEKYEQLFGNFCDWLRQLQSGLKASTQSHVSDIAGRKEQLETVDQLLRNANEGELKLGDCKEQLNTVLKQTRPDGQEGLTKALNKATDDWHEFLNNCRSAREDLSKKLDRIQGCAVEIRKLADWVQRIEYQVKDQSFQPNVELKKVKLEKLNELLQEIATKENETLKLEKASLDSDIETQTIVSQLNSRYQGLIPATQDLITRYTTYVADHEKFNRKHADFIGWINGIKKNLKDNFEVVGVYDVLQDRRDKLTKIIAEYGKKANEMESLVEAGELLYSHTSPEGRDIIRKQTRQLREEYEALGDTATLNLQNLDSCLSQFSDFSSAQDQLTKFLKDIEQSMLANTQLKGSIQEKRSSLCSHKAVNQEIANKEPLCQAVCDKAAELISRTQDKSLQVFVDSINQLFQNIKEKSNGLLEKLESNVTAHCTLDDLIKNFMDWLNQHREKLNSLHDSTGEKGAIIRRLDDIHSLKDDADKGKTQLQKIKDLFPFVASSTSEAGTKAIEAEIASLTEAFQSCVQSAITAEQKLSGVLQSWKEFDTSFQEVTKFCNEQEATFRSHGLYRNLEEKQAALNELVSKSKLVTDYEPKVNEFLDKSHDLARASNVERIKPLIMQLSNRYQLLHVLSKEQVNRYQSLVDDHAAYSNEFQATDASLAKLEDTLTKASVSNVPSLNVDKEKVQQKILAVTSRGEKLHPDTSANGREDIRLELRELAERYDKANATLAELQRKMATDSQQWSSYNDQFNQVVEAISGIEKSVQKEAPNWFSIPDTRAKLMKVKAALQDANSLRKMIDSVGEKGQICIDRNLASAGRNPAEEIKATKLRYEALLKNLILSVSNLEAAVDQSEEWQATTRKLKDFLKNMQDDFNLYNDCNGAKVMLQTRLQRVNELQGKMAEGQGLCEALEAMLSKIPENVPGEAKESMDNELQNLKLDQAELKNRIEDLHERINQKIKQFSKFKDDFEGLATWLGDAENTLKSYLPCNTLGEKEEQLSQYEDFSKVLNSRIRDIQDFVSLADSSQQALQKNLKDSVTKRVDDFRILGSDLVDSAALSDVQQINSRFQAVQVVCKEILKKCNDAVRDHKSYVDESEKFKAWLKDAERKALDVKGSTGSRKELEAKAELLKSLHSQKPFGAGLLNAVTVAGEKLTASTGPEGINAVASNIEELSLAFESFYDGLSSAGREIQEKLLRWSTFDETKDQFVRKLKAIESKLPKELELKSTLDEKRVHLNELRSILHDISSCQQDVLDLKLKATQIEPEDSVTAVQVTDALCQQYNILLSRAQDFVSRYEGIVCNTNNYIKAVQDTQEWFEGTNNTVSLWGNENQDITSCRSNLERLQNLLQSLPEETRIDEIRNLGEKVLPDTAENGQANIRLQINNSVQEFEALRGSIISNIDAHQARLHQWNTFEAEKDRCMERLKEVDGICNAVNLKATLPEKVEQCNVLLSLQAELKGRQLEVDSISEKGLGLQKQALPSRSSATSTLDLTSKYQQLTNKVKELAREWQDYVNNHEDLNASMEQCNGVVQEMAEKLSYCCDLSAASPQDLQDKLSTVQDLLLKKDDGYKLIQKVCTTSQLVLANTDTSGHPAINDAVEAMQTAYSGLCAKMMEAKAQLEENILTQLGIDDKIRQLSKLIDSISPQVEAVVVSKNLNEIRNIEEKLNREALDAESLRSKVGNFAANTALSQPGLDALRRYDALCGVVKELKQEREIQERALETHKAACDELLSFLTLLREKKQQVLGDKLFDVEAANSVFNALMNKQPQASILLDRVLATGEVVMANASVPEKDQIKAGIDDATNNFNSLFKEIERDSANLATTLTQLRGWKEEYERLSDWLQQNEILIKNSKITLLATVQDKKQKVADTKDVISKLVDGEKQMNKLNDSSVVLLNSHLDKYVSTQLQALNSRYKILLNMANDVLKKVENNLECHSEFLKNFENSKRWIENAREIIRECSDTSASSRKEHLEANLESIKNLVQKQEEGQKLVHATVSWGEKAQRTTRSDGKDAISEEMKSIQAEWDRLVKKMASAKVTLETNLLQWADYNTQFTLAQQWLSDRESKLKEVSSKKTVPVAGVSSIGDKKAKLKATNTIVQSIESLEPMIESITTKAGSLLPDEPASQISTQYQTLTKAAQEIYTKQKEMVDNHQAFVDLFNEFNSWLRNAKERLSKNSDPVGDSTEISSKLVQLRVLQAEVPEGQLKLDAALVKGRETCSIVDVEDCEIIERDLAASAEEFDNYSESLKNLQDSLEGSLVRWKEWDDQRANAEEWISKTEQEVKSFNKLKNTLGEKKLALEQFQLQLQAVFDWQEELDKLNLSAQLLLETCADSRVSNSVTQISTKFNALLSLAKLELKKLECEYQEHQQYELNSSECQEWIEKIRNKLSNLSQDTYDLNEAKKRQTELANMKQGLDQGQNMLRYALELKEKVLLSVKKEPDGSERIHEESEKLSLDFEKLMQLYEDTKSKLANRGVYLEELAKMHKLIADWLQEIDFKVRSNKSEDKYHDLSEKRASLEKLKGIKKEVLAHSEVFSRFEDKLVDIPEPAKQPFLEVFSNYRDLKDGLDSDIKSLENMNLEHETYSQEYNEVCNLLNKARAKLGKFADLSGDKDDLSQKLKDLKEFLESLKDVDKRVQHAKALGQSAMETTTHDGKDQIKSECRRLQAEIDSLSLNGQESLRNISNSIDNWDTFEKAYAMVSEQLNSLDRKLKAEPDTESTSPSDLDRSKKLLEDVVSKRPILDDLASKAETLLETTTNDKIGNAVANLQTQYAELVSGVKTLLAKKQRGLVDQSEFINAKQNFESWLQRAEGNIEDSKGFGSEEMMKDKLETLKLVSTKLTEGQHLLNVVQDAFTRVLSIIPGPPESQESIMRKDVAGLRERWDTLNRDLSMRTSELKDSLFKWASLRDGHSRLANRLNEIDLMLKEKNETCPELSNLGDLKYFYKTIESELNNESVELEKLLKEAAELGAEHADPKNEVRSELLKLRDVLNTLLGLAQKKQTDVEQLLKMHSAYTQAVHDAEKKLLETSFALMASNSLYITNRAQTVDQIAEHDALLEDMASYQGTLNGINKKGSELILQFPSTKDVTEKQLRNLQSSFDSLLNTANQIKTRFLDSLAKFEAYENTLDEIANNLNKWEPEIALELQSPISSIADATKRLNLVRTMHNQLQGEKNRLCLAVQEASAAAASLSRPSSPQDAVMQPIPDKEIEVRMRLEDFIDNMQTHMAELSFMTSELENIRAGKDDINAWANNTFEILKDIENKPGKLRSDSAQAELNQLQDIRNETGQRQNALMELEIQESQGVTEKYLPLLEGKLNELNDAINSCIDKRVNIQRRVEENRLRLQELQQCCEEISNELDALEKGGGISSPNKLEMIDNIIHKLGALNDKHSQFKVNSDDTKKLLSTADSDILEESLNAAKRRIVSLEKRAQRKKQLIEAADKNLAEFLKDLNAESETLKQRRASVSVPGGVGFEVAPVEKLIVTIRSVLKELDTKEVVLKTLSHRLHNLQPEIEEAEAQSAASQLESLVSEHASLAAQLKTRVAYLEQALLARKKFAETCEGVKSWAERLSTELEIEPATVPLPSSEIERKMNDLKKVGSLTVNYLETSFAELFQQANALEKDCDDTESERLRGVVAGLKDRILNMSEEARAQITRLGSALQERKLYEEDVRKTNDWIVEAEGFLYSDILSSNYNTDAIQQQLIKYKKLEADSAQATKNFHSASEHGAIIAASLCTPDKELLNNELSVLKAKLDRTKHAIADKLTSSQNDLDKALQISNLLQKTKNFMLKVQAEMNELARPLGSKEEDSQGLLGSYEVLLEDVKYHKSELESTPLELHRSADFPPVLKDLDDLMTELETQITRLRQLLLLQQQYNGHVADITGFISKYQDIVKEITKAPGSVESKIKEFDNVISKFSDCEAQLVSASEKGLRIAEELTVEDRNSITDNLNSLKQQLHALRTDTFRLRSEHELTAAEFVNLAKDLEQAINALHREEAEIKSRPPLSLVSDNEPIFQRHAELANDCKKHVLILESAINGLKDDDVLPPSLIEKVNEAKLLIRAVPEELSSRLKYLQDNKQIRAQLNLDLENLAKWVKETEADLRFPDSGVNFETLEQDLLNYRKHLADQTRIEDQVLKAQKLADKIHPSLIVSEQEPLRTRINDIVGLVQSTQSKVKNYQNSLEQNASLWDKYCDLLGVIKAIMGGVQERLEPATTLVALKSNRNALSAALSKFQQQEPELNNLKETALNIQNRASPASKQAVQKQIESISQEWRDKVATIEKGISDASALATDWEECQTLFGQLEAGLSGIEERFSQIDPSIRSQQQLQDTKKAVEELLRSAKGLESTHDQLLQKSSSILNHLILASEVQHASLKLRLEQMSRQYSACVKLLEDKVAWLNGQDKYLTDADGQIGKLHEQIVQIEKQIQLVQPYDPDLSSLKNELEKLEKQAFEVRTAVTTFSTKLRNSFESLKQLVPPGIAKNMSGLEQELEKLEANLSKKKSGADKAAKDRLEYSSGVESLHKWLESVESRLQIRDEAHLVKEKVLKVSAELPAILEQMERTKMVSKSIMDNTPDKQEAELIKKTVLGLEAELNRVSVLLDEKINSTGEAVSHWQRFNQLYALVMAWVEAKQLFLAEPLRVSSLPDTRQKLNQYAINLKSVKPVRKQLHEMGELHRKIAEISAAGPICEKLNEAESQTSSIETLLLEKSALLQEVAEEYEQMTAKMKEASVFLEKLKTSPAKPKGLRDQLVALEKVTADIHVNKSKLELASEKLEVHFKSGIGGDPSIREEVRVLQRGLADEEEKVLISRRNLESSVAEVDKLNDEVQQLRNQLCQAEQQIRHVSTQLTGDKAAAELTALRERLQSKIKSKTERTKLLLQSGVYF